MTHFFMPNILQTPTDEGKPKASKSHKSFRQKNKIKIRFKYLVYYYNYQTKQLHFN
jgi:hypothetical protein